MKIENYYPFPLIPAFILSVTIIGVTLFHFQPRGLEIERAKEILIVDSTEISGRLYYIWPYEGIVHFRLEQNPQTAYRVILDNVGANEIDSFRATATLRDSIMKLKFNDALYLVKNGGLHYYHI